LGRLLEPIDKRFQWLSANSLFLRKQGIFLPEQGIRPREQGIFSVEQRVEPYRAEQHQ